MIKTKNIWDDLFGPQVEPEYQKEFIPPRNPIEEELAGIWEELLAFDRISMDDRFLELGGYSLLIVKMLFQIMERFGIQITLEDLLTQELTIEGLGKIVERICIESLDHQTSYDTIG